MTLEISTLVVKLKSMGYALFLEGDKLRYKSLSLIEHPQEKVLPLLAMIKANRGAVIEYLRQQEKPGLAYKIYSDVLDACLWVCKTEADRRALRQQGITEPVYTTSEIVELKKMPKDCKGQQALRCVYSIKAVFAGDTKIQ